MPDYTLDLRDRTGGALLEADVVFKSLTAKWVLNGPGSIEIDLRHDADVGAAEAGQAEFQLKRDGTVVWAGPWLSSDVNPRGNRMRLTGEGLWWWFRQRVVTDDLLYTDVAQHQIAWNLLAHTQAQTHGSLGIVQGTHTGTSKTRTRYYCEANVQNVGEEVEAFATYETGFDFAIDPATREFDTWTPGRKSASGLDLSGASLDVLTWQEDVRDVRNYVTAVGDTDCGPVLVTSSDATLANDYGRLHEGLDADDEDDQKSELTELANETLRARKRPRFDATLIAREGGTGAPTFADLVPGNTLLLSDTRGYSTFTDKLLRMIEVSVSLDDGLPGEAVFTIVTSSGSD